MSKTHPNRLTLYLDGPRITAERFVRAVSAFFDLITEVAESVEGRKRPVKWIVTVSEGSTQVHADPLPVKPAVQVGLIATTVLEGVRTIERSARRPPNFSDYALRRVRDLGSVADGAEVERALVKLDRKAVSVRKDAVAHVDRILGVSVKDYGSIEGRLETISVRGGANLAVYDVLTDRKIECLIAPAQLEDAWLALGQRVIVGGLIRYRKTGEPISIEAEHMQVLSASEAISADEVYGILSEA
jgi:hypothetical protein